MNHTSDSKQDALRNAREAVHEIEARPKTVRAVIVENLTRIQGKGSLRAFVSITIAGKLTVHGCRIIQQENQAAWVSMPQREALLADGKKKYYPVVELLDSSLKKQVTDAVLAAFAEGRSE